MIRLLSLALIIASCSSNSDIQRIMNSNDNITLRKYLFLNCPVQSLVELEPEALKPSEAMHSRIVAWTERNSNNWKTEWSYVEHGVPYLIVEQANISFLFYDDVIKIVGAGKSRFIKNKYTLFDRTWKRVESCR
jgi:hypothetical protein